MLYIIYDSYIKSNRIFLETNSFTNEYGIVNWNFDLIFKNNYLNRNNNISPTKFPILYDIEHNIHVLINRDLSSCKKELSYSINLKNLNMEMVINLYLENFKLYLKKLAYTELELNIIYSNKSCEKCKKIVKWILDVENNIKNLNFDGYDLYTIINIDFYKYFYDFIGFPPYTIDELF
jgi:hypothetical protein